MFGGGAEAVIRRVVKYGIGWTQGGGTPETLKAMMERVNAAWKAANRAGKPKFRTLGYFVLGDELHEEAESNLVSYYGEFGSRVWGATIKSAAETKEQVKAFEEVGADELILFMSAPHLDQVDRLAEAVL
jgi:alkanesulfonate monooxygenase SsuD/methylene tetrahydromethanopterin reductase-like flavin-dependent oxidoreductase (luciferase family)